MTAAQEQLVEKMQAEMHEYASEALKGGKTEYRDVATIYLLMKIAELQEMNVYLEERIDTLEQDVSDLQPEEIGWDESDEDEIEPVS